MPHTGCKNFADTLYFPFSVLPQTAASLPKLYVCRGHGHRLSRHRVTEKKEKAPSTSSSSSKTTTKTSLQRCSAASGAHMASEGVRAKVARNTLPSRRNRPPVRAPLVQQQHSFGSRLAPDVTSRHQDPFVRCTVPLFFRPLHYHFLLSLVCAFICLIFSFLCAQVGTRIELPPHQLLLRLLLCNSLCLLFSLYLCFALFGIAVS